MAKRVYGPEVSAAMAAGYVTRENPVTGKVDLFKGERFIRECKSRGAALDAMVEHHRHGVC